MMKVRLNHLGVLSYGMLLGVISAFVGLLYGIALFLFSLSMGGMLSMAFEEAGFGWLSGLVGVGGLIGLPIMFAIMGLILGMITALLYNLAFKVTGGLEVTLDAGTGSLKEFEGFAAAPVQPVSTEPAPWNEE